MQADYVAAFLDFYQNGLEEKTEFGVARAIVEIHKNCPVMHWRNLFKDLDE